MLGQNQETICEEKKLTYESILPRIMRLNLKMKNIRNHFKKGEKMIIPDWAIGLIFSLRARCKPTEKVTMVNNIFMIREKSRWEMLREHCLAPWGRAKRQD